MQFYSVMAKASINCLRSNHHLDCVHDTTSLYIFVQQLTCSFQTSSDEPSLNEFQSFHNRDTACGPQGKPNYYYHQHTLPRIFGPSLHYHCSDWIFYLFTFNKDGGVMIQIVIIVFLVSLLDPVVIFLDHTILDRLGLEVLSRSTVHTIRPHGKRPILKPIGKKLSTGLIRHQPRYKCVRCVPELS
ncbi:hypothetical protein BDA99DRAFT_543629 [Phascolomyces articulosus]|uniref:Uncharacterized protein n=1 Tax=Phascolomyces articulosus TaxID=60185 RepID=A0AAD5JLX9_9FUNG|nr:hypothetical protein BDA99DRAFT_543629 [Phascolomyces articulosus]